MYSYHLRDVYTKFCKKLSVELPRKKFPFKVSIGKQNIFLLVLVLLLLLPLGA
jgi:hypothetical protein